MFIPLTSGVCLLRMVDRNLSTGVFPDVAGDLQKRCTGEARKMDKWNTLVQDHFILQLRKVQGICFGPGGGMKYRMGR